jgi:hypothetical protein
MKPSVEEQLKYAIELLADWCEGVDNGSSWDYWDNYYKEARYTKDIPIRELLDEEFKKRGME